MGSAWTDALEGLLAGEDERLVARVHQPGQPAEQAPIPDDLHPKVAAALGRRGIRSLFTHQVQAWDSVMRDGDTIVTTGTASGKSLCFNLPVLHVLAGDPRARALYLYPTKALAQDQARSLQELQIPELRHAIYDGDTPQGERAAIRRRANVVLTNPDMLHVGILPHHAGWGDFLANLALVIVDEAHVYRGVFGSHVANVLRRLRRLADAYGTRPRFVLTSATIANPLSLAHELTGLDFSLVERDGSPRGPREVVMCNPPLLDERTGRRASALGEASSVFADLIAKGVRTICFARSRRSAELIYQFARNAPRGRRRPRRPGDPLPGGLHAAAAPRDRAPAGERRAARRRDDERARAGHRHRPPRRGDVGDLPRHGREPAPAVGPRGAHRARRPGDVRRGRRRAGPVLLPPSRRSSWTARSRPRSSTTPPRPST